MNTSLTMSNGANADNGWITLFDEETSDWGEGTCEHALSVMLKDYLVSDGDSIAVDTARRLHGFYEQDYLISDPLMKFEVDQGMGGFLSSFYEIIFTLARLIPYNCSEQDKLVRLLLELRQLPPRQFKLWKVFHVLFCAVFIVVLILTSSPGGLPCVDS